MIKDQATPVIDLAHISNKLGGQWVHQDLSLQVSSGEIIAIIGASGCGKTTLLQTILLLRQATSGTVKVFGSDLYACDERALDGIRRRWGVMFQTGALFSSKTVLENILFPLEEYVLLEKSVAISIAQAKLALVGLAPEVAYQIPSELSGGMIKRVALARALAADAELIFLDEPTAGLDPQSASELDVLVKNLSRALGITVVMVTHDLDTLWTITDRVVFLGEGSVIAALPMKDLVHYNHPLVREYFSSARATIRMESKDSKDAT